MILMQKACMRKSNGTMDPEKNSYFRQQMDYEYLFFLPFSDW